MQCSQLKVSLAAYTHTHTHSQRKICHPLWSATVRCAYASASPLPLAHTHTHGTHISVWPLSVASHTVYSTHIQKRGFGYFLASLISHVSSRIVCNAALHVMAYSVCYTLHTLLYYIYACVCDMWESISLSNSLHRYRVVHLCSCHQQQSLRFCCHRRFVVCASSGINKKKKKTSKNIHYIQWLSEWVCMVKEWSISIK